MKINEIKILDSEIKVEEVESTLVKHGLIKLVIREIMIDRIIDEELKKIDNNDIEKIINRFWIENQITNENQYNNFLAENGSPREFQEALIKPIAIDNYKIIGKVK